MRNEAPNQIRVLKNAPQVARFRYNGVLAAWSLEQKGPEGALEAS